MVAAVAYVLIGALLVHFYGDAPTVVSAMASVALVFVTAVLVNVTYNYASATKELVAAQENLVSAQQDQAGAQMDQVAAIDSQVDVLTHPILHLDIQVIERPTRRADVFAPVALEIFIENVGPAEADDIKFTKVDDFNFCVVLPTGTELHSFKELKIMQEGIKRLVPGQKKSLAMIFLEDNQETMVQMKIRPVKVALSYVKNARWGGREFVDSQLLDFPYYLGLVDLLDRMAQIKMKYVA